MFKFRKQNVGLPEIKFTNTLSGKKEVFKPIKKKHIKMYACGPTVYDHIHIGNLLAYLLPDLVRRLFEYDGYKVELVINFTDFGHLTDDGDAGEDKIMKGMKREGYPITLEGMLDFSLPYIESFKTDNLAFGNLPATKFVRASEFIKEQITLIETLVNKGFAYETSDGVYFDIKKYPEYGVLGNVNIEALKAGARVVVNEEKKHPADFALWKKESLGWDSRFGTGFPGWHIECTAMIFATLGKHIDIHTGGEDLAFTHHNAEIAQAKCATGKSYVNYWLHNAHVTIADQKLAKSAGNSIRLADLKERGFSPTDYRYWLLQSHYRTQSNFTFEALGAAKQALQKIKKLVYIELGDLEPGKVDHSYMRDFLAMMADDLNTPQALSVLWQLEKDKTVSPENKLATIQAFDKILGLGLNKSAEEGKDELGLVDEADIPASVQKILSERETARKEKDWKTADKLRNELVDLGYQVEDVSTGPQLTKV